MRSAVIESVPSLERATRPAAIASLAMAVPDNVVTNATVAEGAGRDRAVDRPPHRRARAPSRQRGRAPSGPRHRRRPARARRGRAGGRGGRPRARRHRRRRRAARRTPRRSWPSSWARTRAGAMDVGAACTGFLSALSLAAAQVECGRCENVLVIGADVLSRFIDPADRGTAALFADGAGAAVVGRRQRRPRPDRPHRPARRRHSARRAIRATHDDQIIHMQGHDTFKAAVHRLSESTLEAVDRAGSSSTTSACSSTTRPTPASSRRSASGSASRATA